MEHERIELSWKQFEGKRKYQYWNAVDTGPDVAVDGGKAPEHVPPERDANDGEARRPDFGRS